MGKGLNSYSSTSSSWGVIIYCLRRKASEASLPGGTLYFYNVGEAITPGDGLRKNVSASIRIQTKENRGSRIQGKERRLLENCLWASLTRVIAGYIQKKNLGPCGQRNRFSEN